MANEKNVLAAIEDLRRLIEEWITKDYEPEDAICAFSTILIGLCNEAYENPEEGVQELTEKMRRATGAYAKKFPPSSSVDKSDIGQWYQCKGCGGRCAVFQDGRIAHEKPSYLVGTKGQVPCTLFNQCHSAEFFWAHIAGAPIEKPDSIEDITN